ncbi:NADP-dependent oxidoreductase [Mycolicibacterium sp.]|uniref:NADP-dependent oxidoreductase n=1 Tax=Mycolicibacterium sp. TaxID=2320850 RepID=UPI001A351CF6|nr:NADP-dependent oxidoreductase [Mycolicibacterium sp.]MBJ7337583.1 NADP-dependent oxidoreductase [Mycolicibacterium sp.]
MKAMRFHHFGGPEVIQEDEVTPPRAAPGDVVIRLAATSVNGADWKLGQGLLKDIVHLDFPFAVGLDFSGIVLEFGAGVDSLAVGDRVYGGVHFDRCGTYAEIISVPADTVCKAPAAIPLATAAAVPVAAQTAWGALFLEDQGNLQRDQTVLIHGGAGGVGSFGVQLAKWRGAHVIATASAQNHDYLRSLGAHEAIDYHATDFEDVVHDVDVVFDCVGGELAPRSVPVISTGGRLVSIAGPPDEEVATLADSRGVHSTFFPGDPGQDTLQQITDLINAGMLRVNIAEEYPLARAADALTKNQQGHTRGKILLTANTAD